MNQADTSKSQQLFELSKNYIPGGVNSPVRAFTQVGGTPRFIDRGEGPYVFDVDGNKYIDFIGSWGPMILGHASTLQLDAIRAAVVKGTSFGAPTEIEYELAKLLCETLDGVDKIRLVSSGTEATMSALRLARAYTGRDYLIKFDGCYHGHSDSFLVQAGSGSATQGIQGTPGVPRELSERTISIQFNNLEVLADTLSRNKGDVACVIIEPVPGNMNLVLPHDGYLEGVRKLCDEHNVVLVFDEVMSGFRVALGGASEIYGVKADLYTYGKVIGGGMPMAAFGGSSDIMDLVAPVGSVYQAGTLSGNPVAVSSGLSCLEYLVEENPYENLGAMTSELTSQLQEAADEYEIPFSVNSIGSMFGFYFSPKPVLNFDDAKACDINMFKIFYHEMLSRGVYFAPSAFEAGFLGITHTRDLISEVAVAARNAFNSIREAKS